MMLSIAASLGLAHRSRGASLRLEEEAPEETKIRDLDRQIDTIERRGENAEPLLHDRNSQYRMWIARLEREIVADPNRREYLSGQLERVSVVYGERRPKAG